MIVVQLGKVCNYQSLCEGGEGRREKGGRSERILGM